MSMGSFTEDSVTTFVYWGKKGGGARLAGEIYGEISNSYPTLEAYFSFRTGFKNSELLEVESQNRRIDINISDNYFRSIASISFYRSLIDFWNVNRNMTKRTKLIILMSSPLDTILGPILARRFEVWRVVHDGTKHKGDLWPTNRQIRKWARRDNIITLSQFVQEKIHSYAPSKEIILSSLQRAYVPEVNKPLIKEDYCLMIGRGKKYQIPENLNHLIELLPMKLCLAGANFPSSNFKNTIVMKRWLGESEFENLVKYSKFVICLYSEASQSGVIEQALSHGVPILSSRVGAFGEQIREGIDGYFVEDKSETAVLQLIDKVMNLDRTLIGKNRMGKTLLKSLVDQDFFDAKN